MSTPIPRRNSVRDLSRADREAAVALLVGAFANDPFFLVMFGSAATPYSYDGKAARAFAAALIDLTRLSGGTPRGVFHAETLVGVALLQSPQQPMWQTPLTRMKTAFRELRLGLALGGRRLQLLVRYSKACRALQPHATIHYLMMLAVQPGLQGGGIGRELLQDALHAVDAHPTSRGMGLNTENPENTAFYQQLGFGELGTIPFPGFTSHCMHRSRGTT